MKYLFVNSVCDIGSTGRICSSSARIDMEMKESYKIYFSMMGIG